MPFPNCVTRRGQPGGWPRRSREVCCDHPHRLLLSPLGLHPPWVRPVTSASEALAGPAPAGSLLRVPSDLRSMSRARQGEGGTGEAPGRDETHPPGLASTGRERLLHYAPQGPLPAPRNPDSGPPSYLSVHKAVLRPMRARFVPMAHARVTGRC